MDGQDELNGENRKEGMKLVECRVHIFPYTPQLRTYVLAAVQNQLIVSSSIVPRRLTQSRGCCGLSWS